MSKYPTELAEQAYKLRQKGMTYEEVARELKEKKSRNGKLITRTHVYRWAKSHERDNS